MAGPITGNDFSPIVLSNPGLSFSPYLSVVPLKKSFVLSFIASRRVGIFPGSEIF